MKIKYIIQLCILAALVLTACTDELSREQVPVNGHGISFSVSVTNGWDAPASGTGGGSLPASAAHTSPQAMELHHLLTAVCFKTGDNMAAGTINKITLKNIKYKGTYTFPSSTPWTSDKGSWAIDSDVKDFVYTPSTAFTTDGTANVQVNTGENVFIKEIAHRLMEYQTFPKVLLSSCVKMRIKNTKNTIKPTAL